jgi:hypothetical protein
VSAFEVLSPVDGSVDLRRATAVRGLDAVTGVQSLRLATRPPATLATHATSGPDSGVLS